MQAFAEALEMADDVVHEHEAGPYSPNLATPEQATPASTLAVPSSARITKVSALSDFAPVNLKVKRCVGRFHVLSTLSPFHRLGDEKVTNTTMNEDKIGYLFYCDGLYW
jgi:hypothetical protein